ncbi:conserved hypothetical protein [Exiguobacterium sp. 8A]|uniref:DUF4238 domain-containing protein n=2 Tax=unclassified Exiguobacterium TaxID=2644629 RepID=UPI0012F34C9A|nr:DUF4238 domain-containing protein [Exiguobacterium sp. 8A]VXC01078.1 conserved hypothetical protein [Exiguobacterium sp. 8A]
MKQNQKQKTNQHYVPQFYLENFSKKNKNTYQIAVYDKKRKKSFVSNVRNVASSRYFYDFPSVDQMRNLVEGEKDADHILENYGNDSFFHVQMVENYFSDEVEAQFKGSLSKLKAKYTLSKNPFELRNIFSNEEKQVLSHHIALQLTRTNEFRKTILEADEKVMKALTFMIAKSQFPNVTQNDFEVVRKKEFESITHASHMFDVGESVAQALFNHVWFIGVNESTLPIYTSDNPVVQYSHGPQNELFSSGGIASFGTEIAFPINEKLILIMYEREYWETVGKQRENIFISLSESNITFYNSLQVFQSNSQIYSANEEFSTIKEILERSPEKIQRLEKVEVFGGGEKIL